MTQADGSSYRGERCRLGSARGLCDYVAACTSEDAGVFNRLRYYFRVAGPVGIGPVVRVAIIGSRRDIAIDAGRRRLPNRPVLPGGRRWRLFGRPDTDATLEGRNTAARHGLEEGSGGVVPLKYGYSASPSIRKLESNCKLTRPD